ncbi:MAG TPA: hypothetical protein VGQ83_37040, partial [Polyangia bacterium]
MAPRGWPGWTAVVCALVLPWGTAARGQGLCPAVAATAQLDGCDPPGLDWAFACAADAEPDAQLDPEASTVDGSCWHLATAAPRGARCAATREEPALAAAPAYAVELRFFVPDFAPGCDCAGESCGCTPLVVRVADGARQAGLTVMRRAGVELAGLPDDGAPDGVAWVPVALAAMHTYRLEVDRRGAVTLAVDDVVRHTMPYARLPRAEGPAGAVEVLLDQVATTWLDFVRVEACADAPPGRPLLELGALAVSPQPYVPGRGPVTVTAAATVRAAALSAGARYAVRYELTVGDAFTRRPLVVRAGAAPLAPRRAGTATLRAAWDGMIAPALAVPDGRHPLLLEVRLVRVESRTGRER